MKHENKTLKEFVGDCINLYFNKVKEFVANLSFLSMFIFGFILGLIPFIIAIYFDISIFWTEFIVYLIWTYVFFYITHTGVVLFLGIQFSILYSFLWYFVSIFFI